MLIAVIPKYGVRLPEKIRSPSTAASSRTQSGSSNVARGTAENHRGSPEFGTSPCSDGLHAIELLVDRAQQVVADDLKCTIVIEAKSRDATSSFREVIS